MMNNYFEKAKELWETGKKHFKTLHKKMLTMESKKAKILYAILAGTLCFLLTLFIVAIYKYTYILVLLLILCILKKLESMDNNPSENPNALLFNDENAIYSCIYEAIVETQDILNLKKPLSIRSILLFHPSLPDGYPRFWIKAMKKDVSNTITPEEVEIVLSEEIQRLFFLRSNEFISGISGLYIDIVKDRGSYFELAILPIIPETTDYINRKMQKEQMVYEDIKESGGVYDEQF